MEVISADVRIEKTVRLLNENSSRTLADLASGCTLSVSRLSHLFKAKTGLSVGKFRHNCRLQAAMRMLQRPICRLNRSHTRLAITIHLVLYEPLSFMREYHPATIESTKSESKAQQLLPTKQHKMLVHPVDEGQVATSRSTEK